jgi:hypothetical protein
MIKSLRQIVFRILLATALCSSLLWPQLVRAEITITLKRDFIKKFENRVTIDAKYTIDQAHKTPNPPSKDGDIHIAGRADEIGLATVAEVMNAAGQPKALALVKKETGSGTPVNMTGAWRIWCEHGGDVEHIQGDPLAPFDTTNPPHVFEIHPLLKMNNINVATGWKPIVGFTPKDADQAFITYERTRSRIEVGGDTITIHTTMAGYNYVEFEIELLEAPVEVSDGLMVFATILNLQGEELVHHRRMVFVQGTPPATKAAGLKKGSILHVLGIPRINLTLVDFRTSHVDDPEFKGKDILNWSLPYEMIIVAVYPK